MELRISVFSRASGRSVTWHTLGLGRFNTVVHGSTAGKARQRLMDGLRKTVAKLMPHELTALESVRGRRLRTVKLELTLGSGSERFRFFETVPLILEPRPRGPGLSGALTIAYHPLRPDAWFVHETDRRLEDEAKAFFQKAWSTVQSWEASELATEKKDKLALVAFSASCKPLTSLLEKKKPKPFAMLGGQASAADESLLSRLGTNCTLRVVDGTTTPVMPRAPYRDQLAQLLCGGHKRSVLLVGPSGVGKSALIEQLVADLLEADDYPSHRNLDKLHKVWRVRGQRIIAGMSYLGQWEDRCVKIVEACRRHRGILWVEDVANWGRIGETRASERSLSTFFRGPMARGELLMVGECTAEGYQRLQDESPGFAAAFTTVFVEPTGRDETVRMLIHEARRYERERTVAFDPMVFRMLHDLGGSLSGATAYPGKALDLLRAMATRDLDAPVDLTAAEREVAARRKIHAIKAYRAKTGVGLKDAKEAVEFYMEKGHWGPIAARRSTVQNEPRSLLDDAAGATVQRPDVGPAEVVTFLAARTGMPAVLLDAKRSLDGERVAEQLRRQIMGQEPAIVAMRDLLLRLKSSMADPSRPYGVFLFTGPTGTGKTEMAKCLADYLYGTSARLQRFDMSEYGGPDAPSRLIGDRYSPEGTLTAKVRAQPFSVVLLDEIEKADPSVLNLMLQLFDDGRLTDAAGRRVDFTHTVVIMTSNLGAKKTPSVGFDGEGDDGGDVDAAVRAFFPPELFNRIDQVVKFGALTDEAARRIAQRELDKVVQRRGLVERNVFVRYTPGIVSRVVREGFRARDGARSLKRYLETHVGSLLADTLAGADASAMRMIWLYEADGRMALHVENLAEAEAFGGESPLEVALQWSGDRLRTEVPKALARAEALAGSPALAELSSRISDEIVRFESEGQSEAFDLDALRREVEGLCDDLRMQLDYDPQLDEARGLEGNAEFEGEEAERDQATVFIREHQIRIGGRASAPLLPFTSRQDFLESLGAVRFLEGAVARGADPQAHAVLLELTRISDPPGRTRFGEASRGLFEWLREAYMIGRGFWDAELWIDAQGRRYQGADGRTGGARSLIRIVGPGVREFYAGEHGSHVRDSVSGGTEVVRVRVLPGLDIDLHCHLDGLDAQRAAFIAALESGAELPEHPDAILPIVRRYTFDPASPGAMAWVDVEDYPLMFAHRSMGTNILEAMRTVWLLRMGATDAVVAEEDS